MASFYNRGDICDQTTAVIGIRVLNSLPVLVGEVFKSIDLTAFRRDGDSGDFRCHGLSYQIQIKLWVVGKNERYSNGPECSLA
jgi:hypothetical protein